MLDLELEGHIVQFRFEASQLNSLVFLLYLLNYYTKLGGLCDQGEVWLVQLDCPCSTLQLSPRAGPSLASELSAS